MPGSFQIAYALTSDGRDEFADMALVSALSARLSNPGVRLRILADTESAAALQAARHPVLEVCDDLVAVPAPDDSPVFKNRWVKTQAAEWVEGDCLLLDCDTIVARDLSAAWPLITDVGLVANHNAPDLGGQIWQEDLDFLRRMGWPTDFLFYANGGALFFRPTPAVHQFFRRWHLLWQQGAADSGRLRDQPALNAALRDNEMQVAELPQAFNCQVASIFSRPGETPAIWHFYASQGGNSNGDYAHLLSMARRGDTTVLRRAIDRKILDPTKPVRHGIRFKPGIENSLEPARGRNIALLLSTEYEGIFRNGGIGTYYREISRVFRAKGWVTILLNLGPRPENEVLDLPFLDHVFHATDFADFMELGQVSNRQLACAQRCYFDQFGTRSLFFIQAMANTFPGQRIYAEFHEMCGLGYHAAKARESGWLDPEVVVAVTMHSGHEWIYEANHAILSQDNENFLKAATREEDSYRSADLAMFPSDSLHQIVGSYGWRTGHAAKLSYSIPLPPATPGGTFSSGDTAHPEGDRSVSNPQPEIIFFGRLEERKGLLEFLEAVVGLEAEGNADFSVTFVGKEVPLYSARTGRVSSSEYIRRQFAKSHFPFRLLADFSSEEAIAYVRASPSCVVCLASPSDNFPNTGLEMAQIPAPLVVSDTAGFHQTLELVGRREGVFWFKPSSAKSLRVTLGQALAAVDASITVPTTAAIEATNESLAGRRFELVERAFANNRPNWLDTDWLARVFVLADGDSHAVRATLRSLQGAADNLTEILVLGMSDWATGDQDGLQKSFPQAVFTTTADLHLALADSTAAPATEACNRLLLVCAGTTLQPTTVRTFLEAEVRTRAVMVTAAQFEGPQGKAVRSFQPGSVPLLLRANNTSGTCVMVSRQFVESLPRLTALIPEMLIWQLTLAATATGEKIAYIPYPQYVTPARKAAEIASPGVGEHLALLSRYAAAIEAGRWCRREIFALSLSAKQSAENLREARAESEHHLHEWRRAQSALEKAQDNVTRARDSLEQTQDHLAQMQTRLEQMERHGAQVQSELAAVYSAKSWRVTAPLRLALRCLAAIKSRL